MAMEFSGEYRISARQQQVWDALNDPAVLQACIAGCRQLEKISENEFVATVVAKVGPISATFRGNLVLSDLDPPNSCTLTGSGQGGAAGFAKMSAQVSLKAEQDETLLKYLASAEIGGKLASVGSRLVQTVAKKNADDFFAAFARQLGGAVAEEGLPTAAFEPRRVQLKEPGVRVAASAVETGSLGALVPAWLVLFVAGISFALGYCLASLR
jgi:carbon monoxide dehydrogenase subunit G